jgi:hypothetical protein
MAKTIPGCAVAGKPVFAVVDVAQACG